MRTHMKTILITFFCFLSLQLFSQNEEVIKLKKSYYDYILMLYFKTTQVKNQHMYHNNQSKIYLKLIKEEEIYKE